MKTLALLLIALVCLCASIARADEPTDAERSAARELVWEGDRFFEKRQYEQALSNYSSAYRLVRVPTVGIGIAQSLAALGRLRLALASAEEVASLPAQAGEHPAFAEARTEARALADSLVPRVPVVEIAIRPRVADAEIRIDGASLPKGNAGGHWRLDPGKHTIEVNAPGYSPKTHEIVLAERARQRLDVVLTPLAPAPSAGMTGAPEAATAATSATPPDTASDESRAESARTRGYVALGIAGAAVAAGSITGILAFQTKPDCANDRCGADSQGDLDDSLLYGNIANVSFGVAAVAGIYGLYELLANGQAAPSEAPSAARLELTPRGAGVMLSGAF